MFAEFFAGYLSVIVAAVFLLPVLVFSLALFAEGARRRRWTPSDTAASRSRGGLRRSPAIATTAVAGGGAGLRHSIAAPREHD